MGEMTFEQKALTKAVDSALQEAAQTVTEMCVATPGGRFHVRWDEGGSATALGQLAFFAEFLEVSGLFARWKEGCPTAYTSPNAPTVVNVLGTWLLSILDGQRRYAHVTGLRGDAVAPEILGMSKIISDESLRRALAHLAPEQAKRCSDEDRAARATQLAKSTAWMDAALAESTAKPCTPPGFLTPTPVSSCSTATRRVPKSATTRQNRDGQAIPCIPTGSATFALCSTSKCKAGRARPPNIACPVCAC